VTMKTKTKRKGHGDDRFRKLKIRKAKATGRTV
jgi:hypothetical protein